MWFAIRLITLFLAAIVMALTLAHALEFPGKLRLDKESYLAVQTIYYPGFTIVGIAEPLSAIAALVLFILVRGNLLVSLLTFVSFVALLSVHVIFWIVTQPVNRFWLKAQQLTPLGQRFFSSDTSRVPPAQAETESLDWRQMRDCWEYSHLARAVLSTIAFIFLSVSLLVSN
jgi:hypothetical protein